MADVISALLLQEPEPLLQVPLELQRIVLTALSKDRTQRYQTCAQLLLGARLPGPQLLGELRVPRNVCGISHELRSGFFVRFERRRLEFIARSTAGFAQKNFDLLFSLRQRGLSRRAASSAKYVRTPSAPARLKASRLSIITAS